MKNRKVNKNVNRQGAEKYAKFNKDVPNYVTRDTGFACPVSTHIPWHWGLMYEACPVCPEQRNMGACSSCKLKGDSWKRAEIKSSSKFKDNDD